MTSFRVGPCWRASLAFPAPFFHLFKGCPSDPPKKKSGEQDDPLVLLLFAVGQHAGLVAMQERMRRSDRLFAFQDDLYTLSTPSRLCYCSQRKESKVSAQSSRVLDPRSTHEEKRSPQITSEVVGTSPSPPNRHSAKSVAPLRGSPVVQTNLARARCCKKSWASSDHGPPVSKQGLPNARDRARWSTRGVSGGTLSPWGSIGSDRTDQGRVDGQLGSVEERQTDGHPTGLLAGGRGPRP